jgi:hypothetical protein
MYMVKPFVINKYLTLSEKLKIFFSIVYQLLCLPHFATIKLEKFITFLLSSYEIWESIGFTSEK